MNSLLYLLSGGFAKGYRTYILAGVGVISAVAGWMTGDQTTQDTINSVWQLVLSTSVATAKAGLK